MNVRALAQNVLVNSKAGLEQAGNFVKKEAVQAGKFAVAHKNELAIAGVALTTGVIAGDAMDIMS